MHTVMGENGSGKSTLVKILSAVHRVDSGTISVNGEQVQHLRSPAQAQAAGISTVFQEVLTIPGRTVLENVWVGSRARDIGKTERRERAATVLARLLGGPVDLDAPVERLPLSERQACCIARSLVAAPSLLILDESTSALDIATRDRLFDVIRDMTAQGASVLFISHRMDEVLEISDVVTILRAGATVASRVPAAAASPSELVRLMSGETTSAARRAGQAPGAVVLRTRDLRLAPGATPVDFELRAGELVALAGLEGQGQDAFLKALHGVPTPGGGAALRGNGAGAPVLVGPAVARRHGVGYVPRERRQEGTFEQLPIAENFGLPRLAHDTVGGLIRRRRTVARLDRQAGRLRLKMGHPRDAITTLSGGNQQKVILARTLDDAPEILLLNDPTRGIDQNAKHDLYAVLDELCAQGVAIVMLSSEVDEIVHLADRVLVFRDQAVSASLTGDDVDRARIIAAYFGTAAGDGARPAPGGGSDADQHAATGQ